MDPHMSDEATVCLKEKDIQKLRESEGGVEFEVDEYQNAEEEEEEAFPPEDVLNNVYVPDEEDSDDDDELSPFQKLAKKMEDISPSGDGGVKKRVLHPGGGSIVPEEAIVRVHYNAFLEYADEPYDSTRLRNAPERYKLGQNQLLHGLEICIRTMKKGELAQLLVSPDYAYGKLGIEPRIPGNSTVMFKLELLNFVEHAGIEDYDLMTKEERDKIEFSDILKFVEVERQKGDEFLSTAYTIHDPAKVKLGLQVYKEHAYHKAFGHYKKAAMMLESRNVKDEEEEKTHRGKLFTLYSNMAVCASKQNKFNLVMTYCNKGREIEPNNVKLLFLQGKVRKAHRRSSHFEVARDMLKRAQRMNPNNTEINKELQELDRDIKKFSLVEKDMYQKMFSKPTGQSAEEKEQENLKAKKKLEKNLNVSDDFQKMIEEKLLEFIKDDLQEDMPFPALNLSVGEIACIMEKCENLGLDCKQIGSVPCVPVNAGGGSIVKRHPSGQLLQLVAAVGYSASKESTRDHSGEDTYDTEITTEYSEEFESSDEYDQADATVIKRPNKSQSAPALSSRTRKRVSRNLRSPATVHREAMPSSPTLHGAPDSPDKIIQNNNMGLLEGITTVMRGMMSEVVQVMRNMTETIISSIHGHPITPVKPLTRKSHRGRSSVPSAIRPTRKIHKDHHLRPSDSDSSSNRKQLNSNWLPIFTGKEKWKVWFNRFEAVAKFINLSKKEKLAELLPRLQGIAGDFVFDQLSSEVTRSYRKLVKELKNRFGEIDTTKIYISKFNNREQYNEESVQDFAAELKCYRQGYPRDKRGVSRRFIENLSARASR
ncbi:FKBP6 [Mytilus coruscus]|uniref:peptidylprolyl isomerase n=1 Tax=Mytilus coruscus TaxID=42192 RepID=A0A6J8BKW7_MYTCO|nr:FKBP6 [Mytilus coruscus]